MANSNLPNIVTTLTDGNLNTRQVVDLGDRILLLGTAARGPMNEARRVTSIELAESLFGDIDEGNLVRGYSEVYYAPGGPKDVLLCRIGNGVKATLDIAESTGGSGLSNEYQPTTTSISILAKQPGEIFNSASIRMEVVDSQLSVVFYNPVTELETVIPYDPAGVVENSISNAEELVNALNLDSNFVSHFEASVNYISTEMTIYPSTSESGWVDYEGTYAAPSGNVVIHLGTALELADTDSDDLTEDTAIVTAGTQVTAANNIVEIEECYSKENLLVDLDSAGKSMVLLDNPVQVTAGVADDFLMLDLSADATYDGRAKHLVTGGFIGTGDGTAVDFEFTAYEAIDPATVTVYRTGTNGIPVEITGVTVGSVGGEANDYKAEITVPAAIPLNHIVTIDYTSAEFHLTKVTTLTQVQASNSYKTYYVAGNRLYFGAAQPADLRCAYKARKVFQVGRDISILDAVNGEIAFTNPDSVPNIWDASGAEIVLTVKHMPEWPDIGTSAKSLSTGSNGIDMTNEEKYDALDDAYEALANTPADIVVPIGTYIDDTKTDYDAETGVECEVNAGFAEQLNAHVESLLDGVSETFGVIAVKPIVPADGTSVKAADITTYIENLTEYSMSDVTRAANVMRNLDAKHLDVVAIEPVFASPAITIPYTTSGECLYAGTIAKLPSNSAITNKALSGIVGLRYGLSWRQINDLVGARYIVPMNRPDYGIVFADGVTAAAKTSDWTRRSTFRIVMEAMKNVRRAAMPYLGEGFAGAKRAALDTAIMRVLDAMKGEGKLQDFDWAISQTPAQAVAGTADVRLILHPAFELRRLEVTVELRQS